MRYHKRPPPLSVPHLTTNLSSSRKTARFRQVWWLTSTSSSIIINKHSKNKTNNKSSLRPRNISCTQVDYCFSRTQIRIYQLMSLLRSVILQQDQIMLLIAFRLSIDTNTIPALTPTVVKIQACKVQINRLVEGARRGCKRVRQPRPCQQRIRSVRPQLNSTIPN